MDWPVQGSISEHSHTTLSGISTNMSSQAGKVLVAEANSVSQLGELVTEALPLFCGKCSLGVPPLQLYV